MTQDEQPTGEERQCLEEIFCGVEVDPGTTILHSEYEFLQGIPVRYEVWHWDGITGCSAVVPNSKLAGKSENELVALLRQHFKFGGDHTYSSEGEFTFVSFNFKFD